MFSCLSLKRKWKGGYELGCSLFRGNLGAEIAIFFEKESIVDEDPAPNLNPDLSVIQSSGVAGYCLLPTLV